MRFKQTFPIRFRLEEAPPYTLVDGDTIYTEWDTALDYEGGVEALVMHINDNLSYPNIETDSCIIGKIETQVLIEPDGNIRVLDATDYNGLGTDFFMEAVTTATSTYGKWIPATYQDRKVPTTTDLSFLFRPVNRASCQAAVQIYDDAITLMNEALLEYSEAEDKTTAMAKMDEAVAAVPYDMELRYLRGQIRLEQDDYSGACEDLSLVREISLVNWFDNMLPLICKMSEENK